MGVRGEIFSTRLILPNRTYFLNVKENRLGDLYLNIVESKNKETGGFERQSLIVFADDLPAFLGEFDKALKNLEKIVREQKQGGKKRSGDREESVNRKERQTGRDDRQYKRDNRPGQKPAGSMRSRFEKSSSSGRQTGRDDHQHKRDSRPGSKKDQPADRKRVVIKKKPRGNG